MIQLEVLAWPAAFQRVKLQPMFGMGMGEIILIAIVALLVVGPERLPGAAKAIGKGIRDLRAQTKDLQQTIEQDTQIGDAVREIRGAMRGDPETLYKRATGEDFLAKDKAGPGTGGDKSPDDKDADDKDADESKSIAATFAAEEARVVEALAAPPNQPGTSSGAIADEFANTDDGWGDAPKNPHESDAAAPDLPLIRTPAGAVARGDKTPADDSSSESDNDSEHG